MKRFDENAFESFISLGNLTFSPDGKTCLFTSRKPDLASNSYLSQIWKLDIKSKDYSPVPCSIGKQFLGFTDNDHIMVLSDNQPENGTIFSEMSLENGVLRKMFEVAIPNASASVLNQQFILIEAFASCQPDNHDSEFTVINELPYQMDGAGSISHLRHRLWIYDTKSKSLSPITDPLFQCSTWTFDFKSKTLFFSGEAYNSTPSYQESVFFYQPENTESHKLADLPYPVTTLTAVKDHLFITTCSLKGDDTIYSIDFNGTFLQEFCAEGALGWYLDTDVAMEGGQGFLNVAEDYYFIYSDESGTRICSFDHEKLVYHSPEHFHVRSFAAAPDGTLLAVCLPEHAPLEIFIIRNSIATQITHINTPILKKYTLSSPQALSYTSSSGETLTGWIVPPYRYTPGQKRPGFLLIHGGPRGRFEPVYNSDVQFLSGLGFFVFFTNPHGSSSVSREFADIEDRMGTIDYEDFMRFTDAVCSHTPDIDSERLAVGGVSYGGYMTNWIIGHTTRFKRAVSMSSISDWVHLYSTTDAPWCVECGCVSGKPWTNYHVYCKSSPISYAKNVCTPTLFIQGEKDLRCPVDQAERMYRELIKQGIPAKLELIPEESHHFAVIGQPNHRRQRFESIQNWLKPLDSDLFIKHIQELVAIESVATDSSDPLTPYGEGVANALDYVLSLCKELGFTVKNCDHKTGWAQIGEGDELIGILVHLDTVPKGTGWTHEQGEITDGKFYGRGVSDDKGPTIACIYALKDLLDSGYPLHKRIRIIFGQKEETGQWTDMDFYSKTEELPTFGFTPDADFPLIYAEKGILLLSFSTRNYPADFNIQDGGTAINVVPEHCKVQFTSQNKKNIIIEEFGKAAHGSTPQNGVNAISSVMEKLYKLHENRQIDFPFTEFYHKKLGMDVYGEKLGCASNDTISGPLTINIGRIHLSENNLTIDADIRYPVTCDYASLLARIKEAVKPFSIEVTEINHMKPVYMDAAMPFIQILLNSYRKITKDSTLPLCIGGGTYARAMDNIVAFGALPPGRELTEHKPDEYMFLEDLYQARQIYYDALYQLSITKLLF